MKLVVLDYETFWGPDYTLSKMTTESYIRDPRFIAQGAGIQIGDTQPTWIPKKYLRDVLHSVPWKDCALVGHNLPFDGSILAWHYGITPARYIDTLGLSRALVGCHSPRHGLEYISELLLGITKYPGFLKETYGVIDWWEDLEDKAGRLYCAGPVSPCGQYAGDVTLTWKLLQKLLPLMPATELDALHWCTKIFTQPKIMLDTEMLKEYHAEVVQNKADAMLSVDEMIMQYSADKKIKVAKGKDPKKTVLRSGKHFADILRMMGVEPPTKPSPTATHPDGTPKTTYAFAKTDEGMKSLLEHPDPKVQALVMTKLAVSTNIEETRSLAYLGASTRGPWPVDLRYGGAHTIRFSGGPGGGGNPQNLTRGGTLRDCLYAP